MIEEALDHLSNEISQGLHINTLDILDILDFLLFFLSVFFVCLLAFFIFRSLFLLFFLLPILNLKLSGDLFVKGEVSLTCQACEWHLFLLAVFLFVIVFGLLKGPCHALILLLGQCIVDELPLGLTELLFLLIWHVVESKGKILIVTLFQSLRK